MLSSTTFDILNWEPTAHEKKLLLLTWSNDYDFLYQLGTDAFSYIFKKNPNAKSLFPGLPQYGEHWRDSKEFRRYALKYVQVLSQGIQHLYDMKQYEPKLYELGVKHCAYAARGFRPEHWDLYLDAVDHSLSSHVRSLGTLDNAHKEAAISAWKKLSCYIITHMKNGFISSSVSCDPECSHKSSFQAKMRQ